MLTALIITCHLCGRQESYQGERYAAIVAAVNEHWRKWDRRSGMGECKAHNPLTLPITSIESEREM